MQGTPSQLHMPTEKLSSRTCSNSIEVLAILWANTSDVLNQEPLFQIESIELIVQYELTYII